MNRNLQIEELVSQNEAEVVFLATDEATGAPVILRRFFPFSSNGRGLLDEERVVFEMVVQCLLGIDHPALCRVVAGGVDPVDGFPFVAMERVSGDSLEARLQRGFLRPSEAIEMLDSLLDAAIRVSTVLGRDGLWLETAAPAILWAERGRGAEAVFRIAPIRCLWTGGEWQAAGELVRLTESVLGWQGVMVPDQAGDGLGAWVRWLRAFPAATLAELRDSLAASTLRMAPPIPQLSNEPGSRPPAPLKPVPQRRSRLPLLVTMTGLGLIASGVLWWSTTRPPRKAPVALHSDGRSGAKPGGGTAVPSLRRDPGAPPAVAKRPTPPPQRVRPASDLVTKDRVFQADEIDSIMARFHHEIVMEGVVERVALSGNRKIWYLEFSQNQPPDKARAFLPVAGADPKGDLEQVKALVGKRIRVRGMVDGEIVGREKIRRPKVLMKTRDALEVLN